MINYSSLTLYKYTFYADFSAIAKFITVISGKEENPLRSTMAFILSYPQKKKNGTFSWYLGLHELLSAGV